MKINILGRILAGTSSREVVRIWAKNRLAKYLHYCTEHNNILYLYTIYTEAYTFKVYIHTLLINYCTLMYLKQCIWEFVYTYRGSDLFWTPKGDHVFSP